MLDHIESLKKFRRFGYIIAAFGLVIIFFHPVIFTNKTFFFRDIHRWFYPMKCFLATSFKNLTIPYWCPYYFCGSPFISDIQSGVFYPLSLIFLIPPFYRSFNYFILAHFILGFCFFYLFIKEIGLSKKAAIFTGISYCYGGFTIASINILNNLSTLIWLPAILWSFTRATNDCSKLGHFLTVLFLCMSFLGGEPQLFLMSVSLLFLYGLIVISKNNTIKDYTKVTATIVILIVSALMIAMAQLGPTYNDYQLSVRLGGISYEEATRHSLEPNILKHIIIPLRFPNDFHTAAKSLQGFFPGDEQIAWLLTVYPGFLILPIAILGCFRSFSKRIMFWIFIFIISTLLALGYHTPVYSVFYQVFPYFRFPAKFMFLGNFGLLVLSAYGIDRLFYILHRLKIGPSLIFIFISIILIIDLSSAHKNLNPITDSGLYQEHHQYLDPISNDPEIFRVYVDPDTDLFSTENSILIEHLKWQSLLMPNLGILNNIDHIDGTTGMELRYQYLITEILETPWSEKIQFLKLSNVKYIVSSKKLENNPEINDQIERINPLLYRLKKYSPRAWIVGNLQSIEKGSVEELLKKSFDPFNSAIAEGDIVSRHKVASFSDVDNIFYESNNRIHIELNTKKQGILVLSESSYPGWEVFVDREKKDCLWLNLLFQGVEIESGSHKIDFIYHPKYFKFFLSITITSLIVFVLLWLHCIGFSRKVFVKALKYLPFR